uniref:aconitate hydratase n=1 Tax=Timema tahoe TaxID=61484 RepID=A0A7R9IEX9_9NEOP|nr:unnamed protein product [Timema tahoe]
MEIRKLFRKPPSFHPSEIQTLISPSSAVKINKKLARKPTTPPRWVGFKGFGISSDKLEVSAPLVYEGQEYTLKHGSVVIAAITSCTNTSNPSVMLGAGILAQKAVEAGLSVAPYIKTSLSPGSGVVTYYLEESGVIPYLQKLGFDVVGYGCMTCIGNSGPLPEPVAEVIEKYDLVCSGVLSGNRNFEGRIHPLTRANYLASPLLVIAYAIAGRVDIDFEKEPLGELTLIRYRHNHHSAIHLKWWFQQGKDVFLRDIWPLRDAVQDWPQPSGQGCVLEGHLATMRCCTGLVSRCILLCNIVCLPGRNPAGKDVFLRDIWPLRDAVQEVERKYVIPAMFKEVYSKIECGSPSWRSLESPESSLYPWDDASTYIQQPPFFKDMTKELPTLKPIENAHVLLNLGDSVTTDHISPAGSIARNSPAARYLAKRGLTPREFNSYGSRRGNDSVMARGTFANIRLVNKFIGKSGPKTIHIPSGQSLDVYDAAERYIKDNIPLIALVGKDYGSGSSRDWAAKGPLLLGIKAVIAESFERIHRSNLVGMGIVPLQYLPGQSAESLGLTGKERFTIDIPPDCRPLQEIQVHVDNGLTFPVILRFDTEVDLTYYKHGGILNYMVRRMLQG